MIYIFTANEAVLIDGFSTYVLQHCPTVAVSNHSNPAPDQKIKRSLELEFSIIKTVCKKLIFIDFSLIICFFLFMQ
mgnify:CR=1 FL=1